MELKRLMALSALSIGCLQGAFEKCTESAEYKAADREAAFITDLAKLKAEHGA